MMKRVGWIGILISFFTITANGQLGHEQHEGPADIGKIYFGLNVTKFNPTCANNLKGYVIDDLLFHKTYFFDNYYEFAIIMLDNYDGIVDITNKATNETMHFHGKNSLKNLKHWLPDSENGDYTFYVNFKDHKELKVDFTIDRGMACNEPVQIPENSVHIKKSDYKKHVALPFNNHTAMIGPVRQLGETRGIIASVDFSVPKIKKFTFGAQYRTYNGLRNDEIPSGSDFTRGENGIAVEANTRTEFVVNFWPSYYNGIHVGFKAGTYNTGDFTYGTTVGFTMPMTRFLAVDLSAGLQNTTVEGFITPIYFFFNGKIGIVWDQKKHPTYFLHDPLE